MTTRRSLFANADPEASLRAVVEGLAHDVAGISVPADTISQILEVSKQPDPPNFDAVRLGWCGTFTARWRTKDGAIVSLRLERHDEDIPAEYTLEAL